MIIRLILREILDYEIDELSGTVVNYYFTCKREAWLYHHKIHPDNWDDNIIVGRALADSESKKHKNVFDYLHFDKIKNKNGHFEVTEFKKSLKNSLSAEKQLLFYIYLLHKAIPKLKIVTGYIQSGKKRHKIEVSDDILKSFSLELYELFLVVKSEHPEKEIFKKICKKCAYYDYCF